MLQKTLLGVTLLKDLNHPIGSGLVRGLQTLESGNVTLLEVTLLEVFRHFNLEMTSC